VLLKQKGRSPSIILYYLKCLIVHTKAESAKDFLWHTALLLPVFELFILILPVFVYIFHFIFITIIAVLFEQKSGSPITILYYLKYLIVHTKGESAEDFLKPDTSHVCTSCFIYYYDHSCAFKGGSLSITLYYLKYLIVHTNAESAKDFLLLTVLVLPILILHILMLPALFLLQS